MNIRYVKDAEIDTLESCEKESFESIIIAGTYLINLQNDLFDKVINQSIGLLKEGGILFIQGTPFNLPDRIIDLMNKLTFKYWIAIDSSPQNKSTALPKAHAAVVMFVKGNSYNINKVRFPHKRCIYCNKTLKDWGGKAHLMNPEGYAISDVWKALPKHDNHNNISSAVLEILLNILNTDSKKNILIVPYEGVNFSNGGANANFNVNIKQVTRAEEGELSTKIKDNSLINNVHHGDAIEVLKSFPDNSIDLVFADPPYNLDKSYNSYSDEKAAEEYLSWCNSWLIECVRVLKSTGSLYLLNLPKWAIYHAAFLSNYMQLQNWIVWEALSEPRGKIMPAHYALLYYTAHTTNYTLNYELVKNIDSPNFCLRPSCVKKRGICGIDPKTALTDIWWDIHRIKHKTDRDQHPCQLPEKLLERIILMSSNEGDIVLDPLCGAGVTPIVAAKHNRNYVAIDIDKGYVDIAREKIKQLSLNGFVPKNIVNKQFKEVTKKELQLELRNLAIKLDRLPTREDVSTMSEYDISLFDNAFINWGKALKAAKLERSENVGQGQQ